MGIWCTPRLRRDTEKLLDRGLERETGIEPASLAWKAKVLPLNYSRLPLLRGSPQGHQRRPLRPTHPDTEAGLVFSDTLGWWRRLDSNQRRRKPTDLQSAPFSHSGTPPQHAQRLASRVRKPARRAASEEPEIMGTCDAAVNLSGAPKHRFALSRASKSAKSRCSQPSVRSASLARRRPHRNVADAPFGVSPLLIDRSIN
jgi:hypothetical protein